MIPVLKHEMRSTSETPEEAARARFVSEFRSFILNDLAADLQEGYERRAAPRYQATHGQLPATSSEVHDALRSDPAFKVYSLCRINAQRMVWSAVTPSVEREIDRLEQLADSVAAKPGELRLNKDLQVPKNVTDIEVHLMPGSYTGAGDESPMKQGAVYDRGLAVFSMGLMGDNNDDIGLTMATYIKHRFPDFSPKAILDLGCTIGHNTLPWKQTFPNADVHAVDVAAPCLEYASTRAKLQNVEVNFHQMDASSLDFPDNSFDLVFSSMFLHEISVKTIKQVMKEAFRVLRPGGLMLHMELPPNCEMGAFEGFYLDWDCFYNAEPFYKPFRDQNPRELCQQAEFPSENYFQFVAPSIGIYGEQAIKDAAKADIDVNKSTTGRLAEGVQWFGFGAWK